MHEKAENNRQSNMDKAARSDIMGASHAKDENMMVEFWFLGKINDSVLEKEFGKLQTNEIIVTNERIAHIKVRHPNDYELFERHGVECVQNPDYIIKDDKSKGTVFMVRKLPNTNLNVVSRLALDTDENGMKNSVMTFYRIRERNLKKLIEKNTLLYKKE